MRKFCALFVIGALAYPLIEIVWRGFSHWSMSIAGGLTLNLLWWLEGKFPRQTLRQKCLRGAGIITGVEFVIGCICNIWLKLNVWDYSHLPGNVLGQVCLPFCCLWFLLCLPVFAMIGRARSACALWQHRARHTAG